MCTSQVGLPRWLGADTVYVVYGTAGVCPEGPYQRVAVDIGNPSPTTYGYPLLRALPLLAPNPPSPTS